MQRSSTEMASYVGIGCARSPIAGAWKASGVVCPAGLQCITGTDKKPTIKPRLLSQRLDYMPVETDLYHDFRTAVVMFQSSSDRDPSVCVSLNGTALTTDKPVSHGPVKDCYRQSLFTVTIRVPKNVIDASDHTLCVIVSDGDQECSCNAIPLN